MSPRTAIGFFLNPFINIFFMWVGSDEYNVNPASPAKLIKVFPVLLYLDMSSYAVSRCFMLRRLDRQDVVRGMENSFFLECSRFF